MINNLILKYGDDLIDLKTSVGICTKVKGDGELVIIPQDPDMFDENQVVVIIAGSDFENFTDDMHALIKLVETAKKVNGD